MSIISIFAEFGWGFSTIVAVAVADLARVGGGDLNADPNHGKGDRRGGMMRGLLHLL